MSYKTITAKGAVPLYTRFLSVYGFGIVCILIAAFMLHPLAVDLARFGWIFICVFLCIVLVFVIFMNAKTLRVPHTIVFNDDEHQLEIHYYKYALKNVVLTIPYTSLWFGRYIRGSMFPPFNTIGIYSGKTFQIQIAANQYNWSQADIEELFSELSRVGNKLKDPILFSTSKKKKTQ